MRKLKKNRAMDNYHRINKKVSASIMNAKARNDGGFATEILMDLVAQSYSGNELVARFEKQQKNIASAISYVSAGAENIAYGRKKGADINDVFGDE